MSDISILITERAIEINPENSPESETGAVVEFKGLVRGTENGAVVGGLYYEAYQPMAIRKMEEHLRNLKVKHRFKRFYIIHRIGWVPVAEASLYIRVESSHRGESFKACEEFINLLKKDVPIWKTTKPAG